MGQTDLASRYDLLPELWVAQYIGLETVGKRLGSGTYGKSANFEEEGSQLGYF